MRHLIRTQVIEIETDRPADAFTLQHNVSSMYYRYILPLLEEIFDELSPGDSVTHIDKLEIDLGFMTEIEMQRSGWPVTFRSKIYNQLKEALLITQLNPRVPESIHNVAGQWLYYMRHGFLPWNLSHTPPEWNQKVLEIFASDHVNITLLRKLITDHPYAVRRIVLSHDRSFLIHLLEVLTALNQSPLQPVMETLREIISQKESHKQGLEFETTVWCDILVYSATESSHASASEIIRHCLITALSYESLKHIVSIPKKKLSLEPFAPDIAKSFAGRKEKGKNTNEDTVSAQPLSSKKDELPEEGLFITFAGLVLLHPFLNKFFVRVGCSENGKFKSRDDQDRAITLLHYLACGQTAFQEHEIVMHKTLCGFPLEEPVVCVEINTEELAEADQLLASVISEWSILQNTSIGGLREGFLQRSGKLITSKNGGVRLVVEGNALDVLLDHLPWSVGIIKLPWMSRILKVEWR